MVEELRGKIKTPPWQVHDQLVKPAPFAERNSYGGKLKETKVQGNDDLTQSIRSLPKGSLKQIFRLIQIVKSAKKRGKSGFSFFAVNNTLHESMLGKC